MNETFDRDSHGLEGVSREEAETFFVVICGPVHSVRPSVSRPLMMVRINLLLIQGEDQGPERTFGKKKKI